jgi:hypothetical protein
MPAISANTRELIKGYLEGFLQGLIDAYKNVKLSSQILLKNIYHEFHQKGN